ncbi:MAG: hypothetical protein ACXV8J_07135 [Methylobacter sp.]
MLLTADIAMELMGFTASTDTAPTTTDIVRTITATDIAHTITAEAGEDIIGKVMVGELQAGKATAGKDKVGEARACRGTAGVEEAVGEDEVPVEA